MSRACAVYSIETRMLRVAVADSPSCRCLQEVASRFLPVLQNHSQVSQRFSAEVEQAGAEFQPEPFEKEGACRKNRMSPGREAGRCLLSPLPKDERYERVLPAIAPRQERVRPPNVVSAGNDGVKGARW